MANPGSDKKDYAWLGSAASLLAVAACYGTLATVALLSVIGISIEIDENTLAKMITGLLVLALGGMGYSYSVHRHPGPFLLSVASAAMLLWVFYGSYSKLLELSGFAALIIASIWDFRTKRRICRDKCKDQMNQPTPTAGKD